MKVLLCLVAISSILIGCGEKAPSGDDSMTGMMKENNPTGADKPVVSKEEADKPKEDVGVIQKGNR